MFLLLMMFESPTLRDGVVCLCKLYLVQKAMNFVFQSFIFKWFSIICFLTLFTSLSRFPLTVVLSGLKDSVRE